MLVTLYGTVVAVHRNTDKSRTVTVQIDKREGEYSTYSFPFADENLGLDQRVAVMVQPVEVPLAEKQSAQPQFPEGYVPKPL